MNCNFLKSTQRMAPVGIMCQRKHFRLLQKFIVLVRTIEKYLYLVSGNGIIRLFTANTSGQSAQDDLKRIIFDNKNYCLWWLSLRQQLVATIRQWLPVFKVYRRACVCAFVPCTCAPACEKRHSSVENVCRTHVYLQFPLFMFSLPIIVISFRLRYFFLFVFHFLLWSTKITRVHCAVDLLFIWKYS